jgi:hypothetical protein
MDEICSVRKKGRDLTVDSLKVAGKDSVRDVIILTPHDAVKKGAGTATFKLGYKVNNEGYMASRDFENLAYFNDKVVNRQAAIDLGPNESKVIDDTMTLDIKDGELLVRLDAFSRIAEDDETNNDIKARLVFRGFQGKGEIEPQLHIELLRIAGKPPVQGRIRLTKQQVVEEKKGRFAFPVEYVIRNFGTKPATDFENVFLLGGKRFCSHKDMTLGPGESRLVQKPVYFPPVNGPLAVRMDGNSKYPKAPNCTQVLETQLYFQGFSKA